MAELRRTDPLNIDDRVAANERLADGLFAKNAQLETALAEQMKTMAQAQATIAQLQQQLAEVVERVGAPAPEQPRKSPEDMVTVVNRCPYTLRFTYDALERKIPPREEGKPESGRVRMTRGLADFVRSHTCFFDYRPESEAVVHQVGLIDTDVEIDCDPLPPELVAERSELIKFSDPKIQHSQVRVRFQPGDFARPSLAGPNAGVAAGAEYGINA